MSKSVPVLSDRGIASFLGGARAPLLLTKYSTCNVFLIRGVYNYEGGSEVHQCLNCVP